MALLENYLEIRDLIHLFFKLKGFLTYFITFFLYFLITNPLSYQQLDLYLQFELINHN